MNISAIVLIVIWTFNHNHSKLRALAWITNNPSLITQFNKNCGDCGDRLFLRHPSIRYNGRLGDNDTILQTHYAQFREQSRVKNLSNTQCESYSGFLAVNKKYNSNLFFWFVPAAFQPEKAAVILWLNGGPGTSSLFGLFVENGPFLVNDDGVLESRKYAWTLHHSIIYIDSPVGTGFSFTQNPNGYSKSQAHVSENLYQSLQLFFKVFNNFVPRDFYIAGESYGGKYVPSLALKVHLENQKIESSESGNIKINLKGLMIGSGYFDPYTQNEYGEFLFNLGLIDTLQKSVFVKQEAVVRDLIEQEEWEDATNAAQKLIVGDGQSPSLFESMTGYSDYTNLIEPTRARKFFNYVPYLNESNVRKAIHVGDQEYTRRPEMLENLVQDISQSVKPHMELLLEERYRVLIYSSQFDLVVPHTGIQKFISTMEWSGDDDFAKAPRRAWIIPNIGLVGYTKFARNLAFVLLRNAGHFAPADQPQVMYHLINRFTKGLPF